MDDNWEAYVPIVYQFARKLTNHESDALDVTQETLLRAFRARHRLRDRGALKVWLLRIAHNVWRDGLRSRRERSELTEDLPADLPQPVQVAQARELELEIRRQWQTLPPRQRHVLHLHVNEQLSIDEICETLEMTRSNVKATLSIARKRIREALARVDSTNHAR